MYSSTYSSIIRLATPTSFRRTVGTQVFALVAKIQKAGRPLIQQGVTNLVNLEKLDDLSSSFTVHKEIEIGLINLTNLYSVDSIQFVSFKHANNSFFPEEAVESNIRILVLY